MKLEPVIPQSSSLDDKFTLELSRYELSVLRSICDLTGGSIQLSHRRVAHTLGKLLTDCGIEKEPGNIGFYRGDDGEKIDNCIYFGENETKDSSY